MTEGTSPGAGGPASEGNGTVRQHGLRLGGWSIMGDRVAVEAMCKTGFDFVGIDAQHGFFAFDTAASGLQVANLCRVPCLVRVPADQLGWVPRYLDAGADGVIVAMVSSPAEARQAVALSRYQPWGQRSYGGGPRNGVGAVNGTAADGAPEVFPMIETRAALEAVEEIAAVHGLTGLLVGPVDLGLALGRPHPLPSDDGPWREAVTGVRQACARHGLRSGMFATDAEDARMWAWLGFSDVIVSSDISMLRRAMSQELARARQPVSAQDPVVTAGTAGPYAGR
jgi:4-hydroxy-2-oxoheptanedioate aldolase